MSDNFEHNEHLFINWLKAAIGLRHLKDGLLTYVDMSLQKQHQELRQKFSLNEDNCKHCSCDVLLPYHHSTNTDKWHQTLHDCICLKESGKRLLCPNNETCSRVYDAVLDGHMSRTHFNWRNINFETWLTNNCEFAKGYIDSPGYVDVSSMAALDASALLCIILNNKKIQTDLTKKIAREIKNKSFEERRKRINWRSRRAFGEARKARNEILHSGTLKVTDEQLTTYIDVFKAALNGLPKCIKADKDNHCVELSLEKLAELPENVLCVKCIQTNLTLDALDAIDKDKDGLMLKIETSPNTREFEEELAKMINAERIHRDNLRTWVTTSTANTISLETAKYEELENKRTEQWVTVYEILESKNIPIDPILKNTSPHLNKRAMMAPIRSPETQRLDAYEKIIYW